MIEQDLTLVTAESCTGGLLASTLTRQPGTSKIFDRGFVTYSNESKTELLDVPADIIQQDGAVSPETAEAMAKGALKNSRAGLAVSITGIAGPTGGSEEKPIGLVYFGHALKNGSSGSIKHNFSGSREKIQDEAAHAAIEYLIGVLKKS
jgi:nicotinamide-nucleotide amidase